MKAIILAAGNGTRLMPATLTAAKPLLPLYDKPMVYYPLENIIKAGIKDVLFITREKDQSIFKDLLGSGDHVGMNFQYEVQHEQKGISDAYIIGEKFLGGDPSLLALSDNLFIGDNFSMAMKKLKAALDHRKGGGALGLSVPDPENFGVAEIEGGKVIGIEEKPSQPKSNIIIPGMYFLDGSASNYAKSIAPSARGELEITDLLKCYLDQGNLNIEILDETTNWIDTGNANSLLNAANTIREIEQSSNKKIGCYEISAFEEGFISKEQLQSIGRKLEKSDYGKFILEYVGK
jgi:glucose-1-phosphate thymidylyltransferase